MTFRIGQRVVCIDDQIDVPDGTILISAITGQPTKVGGTLDGLTRGQIYTIASFDMCWMTGGVGVHLSEIKRTPPFRISRFRPVIERKTDISIFTEMLTPSDIQKVSA